MKSHSDKTKIFFKDLNPTKYFADQKPLTKTEEMFTDLEFPPELQSLVQFESKDEIPIFDLLPRDEQNNFKNISWKRIKEIDDEAVLFTDPITPESINQGYLGDCYFLAAVASLAKHPHYIWRLFKTKEYNPLGFYEINLFVNGEWQVVVVDDFIPCRFFSPTFAKPIKHQFWVILLEKAWAKVLGNYYNTTFGSPFFVFHALTGQYSWDINLTNSIECFNSIQSCLKAGGLVGALTKVEKNRINKLGLYAFHIYSIIDAFSIEKKSGFKDQILQLRNPHGSNYWKGDFSNESLSITDYRGKDVKLKENKAGIFFMPFNELINFFSNVSFCEPKANVNFFTLPFTQEGRFFPQIYNLYVDRADEFVLNFNIKLNVFEKD